MIRLRPAALIAGVWSAAWTIVGAGLVWAIPAATGGGPFLFAPAGLPIWTMAGAATGFTFAALLGTAERGATSSRLRFGRVAGWGALAGVTVPLLMTLPLVSMGARPWEVAGFWALVGGSAGIGAVMGAGVHAVVARTRRHDSAPVLNDVKVEA